MVMLEQDPFLTELTKLLVNSKGSGSVWITMKRSSRVGCTKVRLPRSCHGAATALRLVLGE